MCIPVGTLIFLTLSMTSLVDNVAFCHVVSQYTGALPRGPSKGLRALALTFSPSCLLFHSSSEFVVSILFLFEGIVYEKFS